MLFKLQGKKQIAEDRKTLKAELKRLEWETKRNEIIHLIFMLLIAIFMINKYPNLSIGQCVVIFIINLYANIYPILVQRYNRARIIGLRKRDVKNLKRNDQLTSRFT